MKNRFLMILAFLFLGLFLSGGFFTERVMANTVGIYLDSSGFVPDSDTTMDGYMFGVANDTSSNLSGYYINAYSLDGSTVIPDQGIHLFSNDYVYDSGTGTFSLADTLVDRLAALRKFQVRKSPDGFGPSDHAAFYGEGIPVLFLTSGAHEDYHTPADVASKLNYEGLNSITEFAGDLVAGLAALNPAPVFTASVAVPPRSAAPGFGENRSRV